VFCVAGGPRAPADARDELRNRLGAKLDPEVIEIAELLLSELVTNCVIHGAAAEPGARIEVAASVFPQVLWVEVSDGGPAFEHEPRMPSPHADSGRGLYLVQQLATRWGINQGGPTRVWFELPRSPRSF
jgi:anti-sigma regulatory factor (Ser/Thr protein kinase)